MSMLQFDFRLPEFGNLVKDLGLEEGGRAQQHLVKNVARRITKYVPKRTYSSIENAIAQGQEPANGRIVIRGPHVKCLYFGKVMAGRKPKHVTGQRHQNTLPRSTVLPVLSGLNASWLPKRTGSLRMNAGTF